MDPIVISSLRGGLNDRDQPLELAKDQVVIADNVDWDRAAIGGRRQGHIAVTTSGLTTAVVFGYRHLPQGDEGDDAECWAVSVSGTSSVFARKTTAWSLVTPTGTEALDVAEGKYGIRAQSLRGNLFLAYPTVSGTDRLHVWDGTAIRKTGLAEPAAPTLANQGSGSLTGARQYRVRYTKQVSSVTVLRSEPSTAASITPSGSGASVRVTKPAAISEGETHWEVEESVDGGANFYLIATVAVGTTTYDDSLESEVVATTGTLSDDVGDYALQHNPKFLVAADDRLLLGGSWEQPALGSRVAWTPVGNDPGAGNAERLAEDTDPYVDLDPSEGGDLTDMGGPLMGYVYAFKRSRIYKLVPTGNRQKSYTPVTISKIAGAMKRSVVEGVDEHGRPCLYFLDPAVGPSRLGANGLETCGDQISTTWETVNADAALACHGVYYPDVRQVWWYLAFNSDSTPTKKIVASTRYFKQGANGIEGGWSIHDGAYQAALASWMFADNINDGVARSQKLKPLVGTAISGALIAMADTNQTDNGTGYRSYVRTRPYFGPQALVQKWGIRAGALAAVTASGVSVGVSLIRDLGKETLAKSVVLTPAGSETSVVVPIDDLALVECLLVQVELGDSGVASSDWRLEMLSLIPTAGEAM